MLTSLKLLPETYGSIYARRIWGQVDGGLRLELNWRAWVQMYPETAKDLGLGGEDHTIHTIIEAPDVARIENSVDRPVCFPIT